MTQELRVLPMPCTWCGGTADPRTTCPRAVICPTCGAAPGDSCKRPSGHRAAELHAARVYLAEASDRYNAAGTNTPQEGVGSDGARHAKAPAGSEPRRAPGLPPDDWWRGVPCGHPPDPVAWIIEGKPTCHCGWYIGDAAPCGSHVDGTIVPCQQCGCHVLIRTQNDPCPPASVADGRGLDISPFHGGR
jgi:hypothetical protein